MVARTATWGIWRDACAPTGSRQCGPHELETLPGKRCKKGNVVSKGLGGELPNIHTEDRQSFYNTAVAKGPPGNARETHV